MVAKIAGALCALTVAAYYLLHAPIALVALAGAFFAGAIVYDVHQGRKTLKR